MDNSSAQQYHPLRIFLILILIGVTSFFLVLCAAYTYYSITTEFKPVSLPVIFHANTVIILLSSYTLHQAYRSVKNEESDSYYKNLWLTFGLGMAFIVFQVLGWMELFSKGVGMSSKEYGNDGGYLVMISSMHIMHIVGGLVPLSIALWKARRRKKDPVQKLIYDVDPESHFKLRLLEVYWHFIDGLWVYLYLFFILNLYLL